MNKWSTRIWGILALAALVGLIANSAWPPDVLEQFPPPAPPAEGAR